MLNDLLIGNAEREMILVVPSGLTPVELKIVILKRISTNNIEPKDVV